MQLRRFYTERDNLRPGSSVKLPDDQAEHIRKTLRLKAGDKVILFNGRREFAAQMRLITRDTAMAEIESEIIKADTSGLAEITLFQGIIRPANFELVVQKATELGVTTIVPLSTEYSQLKPEQIGGKLARWQKIIIEACKQSERINIPELAPAIHFAELAEAVAEYDLCLLFTLPRPQLTKLTSVKPLLSMVEQIKSAHRIAIIIGPEGGFSPAEHQLAIDMQLPFVSLGDELVLKSETASIAAIAIVHMLNASSLNAEVG